MKVVIGLGNPGKKYELTRHNAGFMFVDTLHDRVSTTDFKEHAKFEALISEVVLAGTKVLLVKPLTFMNLSGKTVLAIKQFYKLDTADFLVVYDDIDLDLGVIRLRAEGSGGTHNGMKDIIGRLGTKVISRLRLGVESRSVQAKKQWNLADYVLSRFDSQELVVLQESFVDAIKVLEDWLKNSTTSEKV